MTYCSEDEIEEKHAAVLDETVLPGFVSRERGGGETRGRDRQRTKKRFLDKKTVLFLFGPLNIKTCDSELSLHHSRPIREEVIRRGPARHKATRLRSLD